MSRRTEMLGSTIQQELGVMILRDHILATAQVEFLYNKRELQP